MRDNDADYRVFVQIEPHRPYKTLLEKGVAECFDLMLLWRDELLVLPNAKRFVYGCTWIEHERLKLDKKDEISFMVSSKNFMDGHRIRHSIYELLKKGSPNFDIRGHRSPPWIEDRNSFFEHAKFHIAVENQRLNNWATEKLIDCFASRTVPIYWGCPNVGEFFDTKGILSFETVFELQGILDNLKPSDYDDMKDAIEHNYEESKKYWDFFARVDAEIDELVK